jgi:hypothetical protein
MALGHKSSEEVVVPLEETDQPWLAKVECRKVKINISIEN